MDYFRRGFPAASYNGSAALRRINLQTPVGIAEQSAEAGRAHMDAALLRLLTQLANCGMDACSPPVLHGRQRLAP